MPRRPPTGQSSDGCVVYADAGRIDDETGQPVPGRPSWRPVAGAAGQGLRPHVRLGPATLLLYDVTTGSANPGSARSGALNHKSPSDRSLTVPGSH